MDLNKIIRAWIDPHYRKSLKPEEYELLPEHPAEFISVSDDEVENMAGGGTNCDFSIGCCPFFTTSCPTVDINCPSATACGD